MACDTHGPNAIRSGKSVSGRHTPPKQVREAMKFQPGTSTHPKNKWGQECQINRDGESNIMETTNQHCFFRQFRELPNTNTPEFWHETSWNHITLQVICISRLSLQNGNPKKRAFNEPWWTQGHKSWRTGNPAARSTIKSPISCTTDGHDYHPRMLTGKVTPPASRMMPNGANPIINHPNRWGLFLGSTISPVFFRFLDDWDLFYDNLWDFVYAHGLPTWFCQPCVGLPWDCPMYAQSTSEEVHPTPWKHLAASVTTVIIKLYIIDVYIYIYIID
jgi:hypothetical protein